MLNNLNSERIMKTRLKNDIIDVMEYFEHGLADVQEGSGEEQPKLKEIRSILRRIKANGAEQSTSNCNIPLVMRSAFKEAYEKWYNTKDDAELGNWLFAKSKGITP